MRYREFVLSPYGVIKIKSLGYNQAKTDELPLFLVMSKQGEILYHNAGWMLPGPNHTACKMDVPCLKALLVEKGALNASDQRRSAPESNLVGMSVALDDGGVLFTAYNLRPMLERIRTIPLVAGAGLFVVLLFSLVVSRHFSLRSLRSVERIRTALHRYSAGEQYVRMPLSTRDDDFHSLSHDIIANRLKNDYILCPDMRQRSIAGCYQNNVAWL
ncbi:hypothetical protein [Symbiopectobacterium purcellii]|uniref:hypothetical protein n=1 Tax=Symbiopectobacterium purcellii TaxID=2871826 RepID=UPI003F82680B